MKKNLTIDWLSTIHSEVNDIYLSNPYPRFDEEITVKIKFLKNEKVQRVILRRLENGTNRHIDMNIENADSSYSIYTCKFKINEKYINYHFIIVTNTNVYYYNRKEVLNYPPTEDYDFVIIADFENPHWVSKSVFYQIFVDRFYNGNSENDIQDNQYYFEGHPTKKNIWGTKPPEYNEGYCLDFYGGDLEGVIEKIPYFKEIGVNAIYLNPIFKARTNHKYDCTDFFNVDEAFGGNEALKKLTEELHKNKMTVIIDVSINHTGSENIWYKKALEAVNSVERKYYYFDSNGNAKKWRGVDSLPQLNYASKELRDIILENENSLVRHYIKEYGIDGWRFDVTMDTGRNNRDQFGNEIFQRVRARTKELNKECYLIGEHWKDNISYLLGDQLDGAMNYFATSRPLRCFAGEVDRYMVSERVLPVNAPYRKTTGFDLANQIMQHYSRIPNQLTFLQFNLIDSHDIHRFHNNTQIFDFRIYKGMIIFMYLLPGTPNIYYGDEIGLNGGITTVEECRYPMEWNREKWNNDFYNLYTILSHLKISENALQNGNFKIIYKDDKSCVIARWNNKKAYIGILTKNELPKEINIPVYEIGILDKVKFYEIYSKNEVLSENGYLKVKLNKNESMLFEGIYS